MALMAGTDWRGPVPYNSGDGDRTPLEAADAIVDYWYVVVHIADGSYEGTISWQRNDAANVSSHFTVAKTGRIAQLVDTHDRAWTQIQGNPRAISIENEGFTGQSLTPEQVEANARILAWAHRTHGIPLQLTGNPDRKGLGHHSMGAESGVNWGHSECPGPKIKAQKPAILARATQIVAEQNGDPDMAFRDDNDARALMYRVDGMRAMADTIDNHVNNPREANELARSLRRIEAALTQSATRETALAAAVTALAELGGADAAPIIAAVNRVGEQLGARITELEADNDALSAELRGYREAEAAADRARADVLDGAPATG